MKWRVISWVCHYVSAQWLNHLFNMINPLYPNCSVCPVNLKRWSGKFPETPETIAMGLTKDAHEWHARGIQEGTNSLHSPTDVGAQLEDNELQQEAERSGTTQGAARSNFTNSSHCLSELRRCVVRKSFRGEDRSVQIPRCASIPRSAIPLTGWNVWELPDLYHHFGFRLATPELYLTTCAAAWSPVTDSTDWMESVIAGLLFATCHCT